MRFMNPISEELLFLLREGKSVYSVSTEPEAKPNRKVVFHCKDGTKKLETKGDHNTFMKWWNDTGSLIHRMRKVDELNEKFD